MPVLHQFSVLCKWSFSKRKITYTHKSFKLSRFSFFFFCCHYPPSSKWSLNSTFSSIMAGYRSTLSHTALLPQQEEYRNYPQWVTKTIFSMPHTQNYTTIISIMFPDLSYTFTSVSEQHTEIQHMSAYCDTLYFRKTEWNTAVLVNEMQINPAVQLCGSIVFGL